MESWDAPPEGPPVENGAAGDDQLRQALAGLPRQQPAVLVLRSYLDLSEAQIADALGCSVGSHYRDVTLEVHGRQIPLPEARLSTACPVQVGTWQVLPQLMNVPRVTATIEAPQRVRRGETLRYEVTLTGEPAELELAELDPADPESCPSYRQGLAGTGVTLRPHCAAIPERPGGTVRLAMELDVPAGAPVGNTRLTWMLVAGDGRVVIGGPANGGVPIEITG